jgi:hypothetical protein
MSSDTVHMTARMDPPIGEVCLLVTVTCPACGGDMNLYEEYGSAHVACTACAHQQTYSGYSAAAIALQAAQIIVREAGG